MRAQNRNPSQVTRTSPILMFFGASSGSSSSQAICVSSGDYGNHSPDTHRTETLSTLPSPSHLSVAMVTFQEEGAQMGAPLTLTTALSPGIRRKQLRWQSAVKNVISQQHLSEEVGVEPARRMYVTDEFIDEINQQIRAKASRGMTKRRSSTAARVQPCGEWGQGGRGRQHSTGSAPHYGSDADFFVRWGHAHHGLYLPTLLHTFRSRALETLYQSHSSHQRRSSLLLASVLDATSKLQLLLLYRALPPPEATPEQDNDHALRGWLTGIFMALAATLAMIMLVCKDADTPRCLRYAGLVSWLSQTTQVLGGLAYGLEGDSSWYVMFSLFCTYTMLPLPLLWAICAGTLTSVLHLCVQAITHMHDAHIFTKLLAKGLLYLSMNTAGLFIHYLTDRAQRQAFLETRRCIQGRMKLEQENQRQARTLIACL
ncbi:hypothetical protein ACEWY4_022000 [Coilia grayii]|uniref:Adenylate cyclase N-terminal domain-containing protein n=1 Tax=Coilia grayii TaxID=363190 RepID=A0ABD1J4X4_9TELE